MLLRLAFDLTCGRLDSSSKLTTMMSMANETDVKGCGGSRAEEKIAFEHQSRAALYIWRARVTSA
jgi:hypothetical protein